MSPECQVVFNASQKLFTTPNHQYLTRTSAGKAQVTDHLVSIAVNDAQYSMMNKRWIKSPVPPSERMKDREKVMSKSATCRTLRDESVSGLTASIYQAHSKTADDTSDRQYWFAQGSGLLLRSEIDLDVVDAGKSHSTMRAEFAGVKAPPANR